MDEPRPNINKTERLVIIIAGVIVLSILLYYCTNSLNTA